MRGSRLVATLATALVIGVGGVPAGVAAASTGTVKVTEKALAAQP